MKVALSLTLSVAGQTALDNLVLAKDAHLGPPPRTRARHKDFRRDPSASIRAALGYDSRPPTSTLGREALAGTSASALKRCVVLPGLCRASQSLDFNKCVTQLHR